MRYCVRCEFHGPTDIADPSFLAALEAAGLLRIESQEPLALVICSPASITVSSSGHWAGMLAERLQAMRNDWTVTVDRDAEVN